MAQSVTSSALSGTRPAMAVSDGSRMAFIDNLRWLVIGMVVVMHACVTYSGLGSWYYKEPAALGVASTLVFSVYQSFAQAFFMGMLFLIAAYFVPRAYDRKGFGRFVRDRLFRLGVPTLVYMLILHPLTELLAQALEHEIDHLNGVLFIDRLESQDKLYKIEPKPPEKEGLEAAKERSVVNSSVSSTTADQPVAPENANAV